MLTTVIAAAMLALPPDAAAAPEPAGVATLRPIEAPDGPGQHWDDGTVGPFPTRAGCERARATVSGAGACFLVESDRWMRPMYFFTLPGAVPPPGALLRP